MKIIQLNIERLRMISKHFKRSEFECSCGCGFASVDVELLDLLEVIRGKFNQPITINSACRCESHNANVGGAKASYHLKGLAADIVVKDVSPEDVYNFVCTYQPNKYGFILYREKNFVHVDVRSNKYRNVV